MDIITEKSIISAVKKEMNSSVENAIRATENSYRDKVFVVVEGERIVSFKKTKRGAESYIKKHTYSYYDEYFQEMRNVGDNYKIVAISVFDIVDYYNNTEIWFDTMFNRWRCGQTNEYILQQANELNCSKDVIDLITKVLEQSTTNSFPNCEMLGLKKVEEVEEVQEVEEVEAATTETPNEITYKMNEEKNGIEIYFSAIPGVDVRENLKIMGFKWSRYNKCWYAKQSNTTIAYAKKLANEEAADVEKIEIVLPEFLDITNFKIREETEKQLINNSLFGDMRKAGYETRSLQKTLSDLLEETKKVVELTDNDYYKKRLIEGFNGFCERYTREMNNYLYTKSVNPGWAVTGRGNLNVSRYNKKQEAIFNKMGKVVEMLDKQRSVLNKYKNKIQAEAKRKQKTAI